MALSAVALRGFAAEADAKLRVAVIGHTGRGNFGHGVDTMWLKLTQTQIVAVADADATGLAAAQKRLKVERGFAEYRQMLAETKPDIVAVCMRHLDQHRDAALAAVEAGAKGIYLEKPFCRSPAEADDIVSACEQRQVACAVAHRNRYHPALPAISRAINDGGIGRLLEIRCRGKEDDRGGPEDFWVLGTHLLNLAHYFAGKPKACSGMLLQDGRPATRDDLRQGGDAIGPIAGHELHARFDTESGVSVFFDSIAKAGQKEASFGMQLIGTQGIIDIRPDQEPMAHLLAGNPFLPKDQPRVWRTISSAGVGQPEPIADVAGQFRDHQFAGRDLIAAIDEHRPPLCNAADARIAIEMVTGVLQSHCQGGKTVFWPLEQRTNPLVDWSK